MPNSHFSNYVSPNIVIVPTLSFCGPAITRQKPNAECQPAMQAISVAPENRSLCAEVFPIENLTKVECQPRTQVIPVLPVANNRSPCAQMFPIEKKSNLECQPTTQTFPVAPVENNNGLYDSMFHTENISDEIKFPTENISNSVPIQKEPKYAEDTRRYYLEDSELRVKKTLSWASNYLQSIGQLQPKVIKLTNSAQPKFIPTAEDGKIRGKMQGAEQNTNKNLFKPTFRYLDVAKSHPNSLEQRSYTKSPKNITPMQSHSATDSYDTKHPIKINLINNKQYTTDTYSKENNINIDGSNKSVFMKPNTEKSIDCLSMHSYSKSGNRNDMNNEKCVKNLKTQHVEKSRVSEPSHSKSRVIKNVEKEKNDKDIKNTKSMRSPKRDISLKKYAGKDRIKETKESKLMVKTKEVDKCPSNLRHKSKDRLEALAFDRIKSQPKKHLYSNSKGVLEARSSNRNKTISNKQANSRKNKSPVNYRSETKNEKNKLKARESTVKKNKGSDGKIKSKTLTKCEDNDNKNILKSNENSHNKKSEIPHSTPIKSVVQVPNNYDIDSSFKTVPENGHNIKDLRTKLKRKYQNTQTTKRDNLIITVQNDNNDKDINKQPTAERKMKSEKKTKKYKKIKLVINVVCENSSESSESDSDIENNEESPLGNVDLSFLDDFNIDDIVESLNDQKDKVNINMCPSETMDAKNITENLVGKQIIKNENIEEEYTILQNRFVTESQEQKMCLKQCINALEVKENNDKTYRPYEITGNVIENFNNIVNSVQNKIEKTELRGNSDIGLVTETSNKLIISPIKLETNQNNFRNDLLNLDITSDICIYNMDEEPKKSFQFLDTNTDQKLIDSQLHIESNVIDITNITSETKTQTEAAKDAIIIDLTQIDTGKPQQVEKTSSNKDILNTCLSNKVAAKQRKSREISKTKAIIDLTQSSETTLKIKKDVAASVIQTSASAQQQLKIKDTSTKCNTVAHSISLTNNDIIDLTIPAESNKAKVTPCINRQMVKTHQPEAKENLAKDNNHSQPTETASEIKDYKVTPAKTEVGRNLPNNAAIQNNIKKIEIEHDTVNEWTTEITAEACQHDMNKLSSNNPAMKNTAEIGPLKNDIIIGKSAEKAPGLQQNKTNKISLNNDKIEIDTNILQQLKTNETLSNNAEMKNITQETFVKKDVVNESRAQIPTEPSHPHETNKMSLKSCVNAQSTETASSTKTANSQVCQQVRSNRKPTSKQEQPRTVKETNLGDDCEDVLSISDSLDENLTNYNIAPSDSDKTAIYSPTSSIKTLVIFDAKEATTETIKSIPESKATETKTDDKSPIDRNKKKSDSVTVTAKLNCKKNEELLALENRMLGYLGAKYNIESLISHGKFSKIYLCKNENGRNYALKVLNKGNRITGCQIEDMLKNLQKDIPRQNYHCVSLVNGFAMLDQWCLLMDYYPKNLQEILYENGKCFHVDVVQTLARQLLSAVLILRNNNIMHLDIKPSHILMNTSNDRLKLAGFDESQYLEGLSVLPCVGTVNYRPPEVILGFPYFGKIDVWSTALVIYEMCTARQLFPGHYNNDILYKQMCTLGNIPYEMVIQSVFANKHYRGACFARRYGPAWHQCDLIDEFNKSMRLATSLFEAYQRDWANFRTRRQKGEDWAKLRILRDLLEDMLMLDPNYRTPIEFVYVNPFIYETFNTCM